MEREIREEEFSYIPRDIQCNERAQARDGCWEKGKYLSNQGYQRGNWLLSENEWKIILKFERAYRSYAVEYRVFDSREWSKGKGIDRTA